MNRTRWKWMIAGLGLSLAGLAVAGVPEGAGGLSCISQSHQVARVMPEAPITIPVPKVADLPPGNVAPPTLPELPPPASEPVGMPPGIPVPAPAPVPLPALPAPPTLPTPVPTTPVPAVPVALPSPVPASLPTPEPVPVSIPAPSSTPSPTPSNVPIPALPSAPIPAPAIPGEPPRKPVSPPPAMPLIPAPNVAPQTPAEVPALPLPALPAAPTPAPVPGPEFKAGAAVPPSNPREGNRSTSRAPSLAKLNVHLHLGDERPRFEVRSEEVIYLKVTSDQVEVKSPPVETSTGAAAGSGAGLAQMRAQGRVRFVTPGGEGTCQELIVSPGTGQVIVSGSVSFTYNWGKLETTVTGEKMTFNLGATPGTTAGVPPGTTAEASAPAFRRTGGNPSDSPNP